MSRILLTSVAAVAVLATAQSASAQTEIQWWHAMGGKLGEAVGTMADTFNKSQSEYKVVPVFKGTYSETFTAAVAAFRAKQFAGRFRQHDIARALLVQSDVGFDLDALCFHKKQR